MARLDDTTDLAGMFGIEMAEDLAPQADVAAAVASATCPKCHGRGNFIGYTGRIVGKCFACHGTGLRDEAAPKPMMGLHRIVKMMRDAAARLKHPRVVFTADGTDYRLNVAGPMARIPGSINVTSTGAFEDRSWFGRILPDGTFEPNGRLPESAAVGAALQCFDADPVKASREYGQRTGRCCYCTLELTDKRSVTVGYGPICAEKYGLPWGEG